MDFSSLKAASSATRQESTSRLCDNVSEILPASEEDEEDDDSKRTAINAGNYVHLLQNHQSRRSTITFLIKDKVPSPSAADGPSSGCQAHAHYLMVSEDEEDCEASASPRPSLPSRRSGSLDDSARSWNIKGGHRRASSVLSANSTALRVSLNKALLNTNLNQNNVITLNPVTMMTSPNHSVNTATSVVSSARRQSSSETRKELRLARISLCIVWLFLFCHVWKLVPTFYSTFLQDSASMDDEDLALGISVIWPDWLQTIENISHTLITLNSSLNFLIYIVL